MRSYKLSISALILSFASLGLAGSVSVTASGGYVAAMNTNSGTWSGLSGSASTSTMTFSDGSTQDKFNTGSDGTVTSRNFTPVTSSEGNTSTTTTGGSSVSSKGGTTYYNAQWSSTTSSDTATTLSAGSGTYDPWVVTYSDLNKAGVYSTAGTESFYYQSGLAGGIFDLGAGQKASYNFNLSVKGFQFVNLTVHSDGNLDIGFNTYDHFDVYLLAPGAYSDKKTSIPNRLAQGTLLSTKAQGLAAITDYLNANLEDDGSLDSAITFGVVYKGVQLPTYDPNNGNTPVVDFHSNTFQAVPEPSSIAALGLGALALLRRRKR